MTQLEMKVGLDASQALPIVRKIGIMDLKDALAKGLDDFRAIPTHVIFLSLIYPVGALIVAQLTLNDLVHLFFPLAAGFALIGPVAALGLYELSRRRELGLDLWWTHAFDVRHSRSIGGILTLGVLLTVIFLLWVAVAQAIYIATFGNSPPGLTIIGAVFGSRFSSASNTGDAKSRAFRRAGVSSVKYPCEAPSARDATSVTQLSAYLHRRRPLSSRPSTHRARAADRRHCAAVHAWR